MDGVRVLFSRGLSKVAYKAGAGGGCLRGGGGDCSSTVHRQFRVGCQGRTEQTELKPIV